ncbi:MAG TPA: PQQ-binding-like beta-propeller repeat protein [Acidimicrobiales bacterium]|nr:PQQ-binding-like beta-propeller repeat protein [Acidimicrobiales bacterium]
MSDGVSVAVTGPDGRAILPDDGRPFAWVSRPSGHDARTWFHRLDDHDGPVTFELHAVDQPSPLSFAQITDLHVSDLPEPESLPLADSLYGYDGDGTLVGRPLTGVADLERVLREVAGMEGPAGRPAFVVATGDLTDHGTVGEFALLRQALATSALPVHVLPGNHDHYGHNHDPRPDDDPVDSHGMGTGTTTRYEDEVGPRWWSLTCAGLRLVALDWFSHRLGRDRDDQERWLAADLATAPAGAPVLFLTHDQMAADFFARVAEVAPHVRVVGSLSGHWHTSRVVRSDGQVHANTGNATFGSFDWAPAHARLYGWDADELTVRTVALGGGAALGSSTFAAAPGPPVSAGGAGWAVRLPGAVHLARPLGLDDAVVVAWSDDDRAAGGLSCHDTGTGEERWRVALDAPVRAGATLVEGAGVVVGVSISGGVVAVDAATGQERWRAQVGDRLIAWVHAAPVVLDGAVAVGEVRCLAALDVADGRVRWQRDDLGRPENTATPMQGVVQDATLVVPFSLMPQHTFGLDPDTGATRWSRDGQAMHAATSDVVPDPEGSDVYLTRLGGRVERSSAATGEVRWAAKVRAAFATGRPLVTDGSVVVTSALGAVHRFDAETGTEVWRTQLPGDSLLAMGPYRRSGLAVPAGPALGAGTIIQTTGDGGVHRIDLATGHQACLAALGCPLTVPAVVVGDDVIVATAEGSLLRLVG